MKRLLPLVALGLGLYAPAAHAQTPIGCGINYNPVVGVNCGNVRGNTYSAAIKSLVPEATAATDFFCITASPTRKIHVSRIELSGTGTAATQVINLFHNSVKDTGTTAVVATYGPVPEPLSTGNPTATAITVAYNSTSGNPTGGVSNTATLIRSGEFAVVAATVGIPAPALVWSFGTTTEGYDQRLDLAAGGTDQYCLNFNGATVTASVLQGYIQWTEE